MSRGHSSGEFFPILVFTDTRISPPVTMGSEKILSKSASSSSGYIKSPEPFFLAVTVPDGQPRFRLISRYPRSRKSLAPFRKPSG